MLKLKISPMDNSTFQDVLYNSLRTLKNSGGGHSVSSVMRMITSSRTFVVTSDDNIVGFATYAVKDTVFCKVVYILEPFRKTIVATTIRDELYRIATENDMNITFMYHKDNQEMKKIADRISVTTPARIRYNSSLLHRTIPISRRI